MTNSPLHAPPTHKLKPKLRGVSHELATYASAIAGAYLVSQTHTETGDTGPLLGAVIYSLCLFSLFAISAIYHRPTWGPEARAWVRRLDHSAIYLLIAGTATPIGIIALDGTPRKAFLLTLWIGASLGVIKSLAWIRAPKPLSALAYVLIGLSATPFLGRISESIGARPLTLIIAGGALYILGAVIYAVKKPDPLPEIFGYHEIFHALVIAAAACHYIAILEVVRTL